MLVGDLDHVGGLLAEIPSTVTRLPEADLIVALDSNGHIVQQGTFNELASSPGYVEELKIADTTTAEQDAELEHEVPDTEAEIKQVKEHARALEEAQAPPSDRSVFKYYFESCSAINLATVGLLCSACEVTRVIRCKLGRLLLCT